MASANKQAAYMALAKEITGALVRMKCIVSADVRMTELGKPKILIRTNEPLNSNDIVAVKQGVGMAVGNCMSFEFGSPIRKRVIRCGRKYKKKK